MPTDTLCTVATARGNQQRRSLDVRPLVELIDSVGGIDRLSPTPAQRRAYFRAKARGRISEKGADALATELLGLHPLSIWGDAWLFSGSE